MKIAIIGAGAMGSLFGGLLAEAGHDVCLYERQSAVVDLINLDGLRIERDGVMRRIGVRASSDSGTVRGQHLVMVFVKAFQTRAVAPLAAQLAGHDGFVMSLQNGMGNAEALAERTDPERIIAGSTAHGATLLGPGQVRHAGSGATIIGAWTESSAGRQRVGAIADAFNAAGIATRQVNDVRGVLWEKLLVNAGINAITALTNISNGQLLTLDTTRALSAAAVTEGVAVAQALGLAVRADIVAHVFEVARATAANRSSMGQDVDHRRPTEIAAINGFIVREATRLGVAAPVNEALTALVETMTRAYTDEPA